MSACPRARRWGRGLLVLVALCLLCLLGWARWGAGARDLYRRGWTQARPGRPTVIFAVLDTVRADHTSLCGYDRPTTPTLQRLAAAGRHTCRAYAPGSWTLPTHASFFTGLPVLQHGVHELPLASVDITSDASSIPARTLGPKLPTLAEDMARAGYQTVAVSGNPVVCKNTGLMRGFQVEKAAEHFRDLDDDDLVAQVRRELRNRLDPRGRPLFLFVNMADAHQPWRAVPDDVGWARSRPALGWSASKSGPWQRFLTGKMSDGQGRALLARVTDLYDYGVYEADHTLGDVLAEVEAEGWCADGCRVIAASDHGEFLGEHGLIDHGFYAWEPNSQVFLVDSEPGEPFPEPLNATHAFHLVRDGVLPEVLLPVTTVAWPDARRAKRTGGLAYGVTSAAQWFGWSKLLWMDGVTRGYDLAHDPGETHPIGLSAGGTFDALVAGIRAVSPETDVDPADQGVMAALKAAGYIE